MLKGGALCTLSASIMGFQFFVVEVRAGRSTTFPRLVFYDSRKIMKKSISDNRKKGRGRPATGTAPMMGIRMTDELQAEIRAWANKQEDEPPFATAVRRLVELGLKVKS